MKMRRPAFLVIADFITKVSYKQKQLQGFGRFLAAVFVLYSPRRKGCVVEIYVNLSS